jgi:hypothetical protein
VALDKNEGGVKGIVVLGSTAAPLFRQAFLSIRVFHSKIFSNCDA